MLVYHTSDKIVDTPDIMHSRNALDFGKGFYVTQLKEQALNYADRFFKIGKTPYLHEFEYNPSFNFKTKVFEAYNKEWLEFVCSCRRGSELYKEQDAIDDCLKLIKFNPIENG